MGKRYAIDKALLTEKPEIEIGNKIYVVDDRLTTFEKLNKALEKAKDNEFDVIFANFLGEAAAKEIKEMDLSFAATQKLSAYIMAAVQDITVEEAEARFQKFGP